MFVPFTLFQVRADRRATTASDILVRVAADDRRHFIAAVAHQMSVYASSESAFLGSGHDLNALQANIAPQSRHFFMGPAQLSQRAYTEVRGQF